MIFTILGDPGADSGDSSRRSLLFFVPIIFFRPFRLSLAPFICPWVSEDVFPSPASKLLYSSTLMLTAAFTSAKYYNTAVLWKWGPLSKKKRFHLNAFRKDTVDARLRKGRTWIAVPLQVTPSVSKECPGLHEQIFPKFVLVQKSVHPPLFTRHGSTTPVDKDRKYKHGIQQD